VRCGGAGCYMCADYQSSNALQLADGFFGFRDTNRRKARIHASSAATG